MDSVRFGRALGTGARLAARTLVTAVDAAAAPNPSAPAARAPSQPPRQPVASPERAGQRGTRTTGSVRRTTKGFAQGSRRFGEALWGPVVKLSGVLWLEFTGVFFGLFALSAAVGTWKLRGNLYLHPGNSEAHTHLLLAAGVATVFAYFCITSFVRASRRGRRH